MTGAQNGLSLSSVGTSCAAPEHCLTVRSAKARYQLTVARSARPTSSGRAPIWYWMRVLSGLSQGQSALSGRLIRRARVLSGLSTCPDGAQSELETSLS